MSGDIKFLQLCSGILGGNSSYPCWFCNWRSGTDPIEHIGSDRDIDMNRVAFDVFNDRSIDLGQFSHHSCLSAEFSIPILHILQVDFLI